MKKALLSFTRFNTRDVIETSGFAYIIPNQILEYASVSGDHIVSSNGSWLYLYDSSSNLLTPEADGVYMLIPGAYGYANFGTYQDIHTTVEKISSSEGGDIRNTWERIMEWVGNNQSAF